MTDPIRIVGPTVALRELQEDDFDRVHAYGSDPRVVRFLTWGPNSEEETRSFLQTAAQERSELPRLDYTLAVIHRATDQLIGTMGLHKRGTNAMLGYAFHPDAWGRGFATEAGQLLLEFGFGALDLHRIWAGCDPENDGSRRVLEKLGMRQEGHLQEEAQVRGEFRDTLLFAVLVHEWRGSRLESD